MAQLSIGLMALIAVLIADGMATNDFIAMATHASGGSWDQKIYVLALLVIVLGVHVFVVKHLIDTFARLVSRSRDRRPSQGA
jgi:hypothetical protein